MQELHRDRSVLKITVCCSAAHGTMAVFHPNQASVSTEILQRFDLVISHHIALTGQGVFIFHGCTLGQVW